MSEQANQGKTPANVGLYGKYYGLRRTSDAEFRQSRDAEPVEVKPGSLVEGWYFVIREGDPAGQKALLAYADACEDYAPELAHDLRTHVRDAGLAAKDDDWECGACGAPIPPSRPINEPCSCRNKP